MSIPPYTPEDDADELDNTQRNPTGTQPLPLPPPLPPGQRGHVQPHLPEQRATRGKRGTGELRQMGAAAPPPPPALMPRPARLRKRGRSKSDSGLFLPAWSVILMLVVVFAIAGGIVVLVMALGGQSRPGGDARVLIITAMPSDTPIARPQEVIPTLPASGTQGALPTFALEGPSLPTAVLTPTPARINVGSTVEVINVSESGLNVRRGAGTSNEVVFRATEGDTFIVIGGPETAEDLTWWQLQSVTNSRNSGWAVENDSEQDVLAIVPPTPQATETGAANV
jgi:hypothetical protein